MKASRIGLVFASLLMAGLFSGAAYAACPCVGGNSVEGACNDPGDPSAMPDPIPPESNTPHGPNDCTDDPRGLRDLSPVLPGTNTDGVGCIEAGVINRNGEDDCAACIGGVIDHNPDTGNRVLLMGCACKLNPDPLEGGWICVSTAGVEIDENGDPVVPPILPIPPIPDHVWPELVSGDGSSLCEERAEAACMLND